MKNFLGQNLARGLLKLVKNVEVSLTFFFLENYGQGSDQPFTSGLCQGVGSKICPSFTQSHEKKETNFFTQNNVLK